MKSKICLIMLLLNLSLISLCKHRNHNHHLRRKSHQIPLPLSNKLEPLKNTAEKLEETPKAGDLSNHFGLRKNLNNYGPKETYSTKNFMVKNADGTWENTESVKAKITGLGSCDIAQHPFYTICSGITECGLCASNNNCGNFIYFFMFFFKYL